MNLKEASKVDIEEDEDVDARQELHEAIQGILEPEEGMLSGWVLVYETARSGDTRHLTVISSDATGDRGLPAWTSEGWMNYIGHSGTPLGSYEDSFEDDDFEDEDDED